MNILILLAALSICWISVEAKTSKKSPERALRQLKKAKSAKALDYHSITIEEIKASKKNSSGKGGKNKNWKGVGYGNEPANPLGKGRSSKSSKSNKSSKCSGKGKGYNCNTVTPTVSSYPTSKPSISLSPSIAPTTSIAPTSFPTIEFDLQVCRSFSQIWYVHRFAWLMIIISYLICNDCNTTGLGICQKLAFPEVTLRVVNVDMPRRRLKVAISTVKLTSVPQTVLFVTFV